MSKELTPLEALNEIKNIKTLSVPERKVVTFQEKYKEELDIIETALKEYEKLKKEVNEISDFGLKAYRVELEKQINSNKKYRTTNKRLRVKNQKLYEILRIIKEKHVDCFKLIAIFRTSNNIEHYNQNYGSNWQLTQEEYDLLKEVLI